MQYTQLRKKALSLPLSPGVYLMKDTQGRIIYVGKAKRLKNRVVSYFRFQKNIDQKVRKMVESVRDFDVIITQTEFEALVLECTLIKNHQPKYNIRLKDDKGYYFIRITDDPWPSIELAPRIPEDGVRVFGPLGTHGSAAAAIAAVKDTLRLPTCSRRFPRDIGKERPCLQKHLGRCVAPCEGGFSKEQYLDLIDEAELLLQGRHEDLETMLQKEMGAAAENLEFERAAQLRNRLRAVSGLGQRQKILFAGKSDTDVIGLAAGESQHCIAVLHIIGGALLGRDVEFIDAALDSHKGEILSGYIKQAYAGRSRLPKTLLLSHPVEDTALLSRLLTETAGRKVEIISPQKGEKRRLTDMAAENARDELARMTDREEKTDKTLLHCMQMLGLESPPVRIEAYDISNTAGRDIVGAMVVFENALPNKKDYRRFKIQSAEGQDDYLCMREILMRRLKAWREGDTKFAVLPDLVLVDGGQGHASSARQVLDELNMELPVYGMVKDDGHRTRALVAPSGEEIGLSGSPAVFSLVGRIQEEAHRFAVTYHRSLREGKKIGSVLDKIPGVGAARRKKLLSTFKSVKNIRDATEDQLAQVVPRGVAKTVREFFNGKNVET